MKKLAVFVLIAILSSLAVNAMMDPFTKECRQRGYESLYYGNIKYCVFLDGNKCPLQDFNNGVCGVEYKMDNYCVREGVPVWDRDKCCEGTEAYLAPGYMGQPRCLKVSILQKIVDIIKYNPFLPAGIILLILFVIFWLRRKRKQ